MAWMGCVVVRRGVCVHVLVFRSEKIRSYEDVWQCDDYCAAVASRNRASCEADIWRIRLPTWRCTLHESTESTMNVTEPCSLTPREAEVGGHAWLGAWRDIVRYSSRGVRVDTRGSGC